MKNTMCNYRNNFRARFSLFALSAHYLWLDSLSFQWMFLFLWFLTRCAFNLVFCNQPSVQEKFSAFWIFSICMYVTLAFGGNNSCSLNDVNVSAWEATNKNGSMLKESQPGGTNHERKKNMENHGSFSN